MKPTASAGINIAGLRERRKMRRRYLVWGTGLAAVCAVVLFLAWLALRSPVFRIKTVSVVGNERVGNDEIMSLLYGRIFGGKSWKAIFGLNNLLIWPNKLSEDDLKLLPQLKSLAMEESFLERSVVVRVEEREPYGIWCYASQAEAADSGDSASSTTAAAEAPKDCWWFDGSGLIFQKSLSAEGSFITTVDDYSQKSGGLNSKILPDEFIPNMFSVFDVLKASGIAPKEIRLNDLTLQEIEVDTYAGLPTEASAKTGPKLYFSLRFPSSNYLPVIQKFLSKPDFGKLQYLDFRVENRAYYK